MPNKGAFIAALPKVELHLHLVGSASPATVLELARRHPGQGVPVDPDLLREFYTFRDFPHFLEVYGAVSGLVKTGDDITAMVSGLARDAAQNNVRYAEVTVTPATHLHCGIDPDELAEALENGRRIAREAHNVSLNWIFDIAGEVGPERAWDTVAFALRHRPPGLVALGLAGLEVGRAQFRRHFAVAREAGLASVVHAGETGGPKTIWAAVNDLGAVRIGHGVNGVTDPRLLDYMREHLITIEACPTSNVCTRSVASLNEHPLPRFLDFGVPVTLSTDDPGMFGVSLNEEYEKVATAFGLTDTEISHLVLTGIRGALCDEIERDRLERQLETALSVESSRQRGDAISQIVADHLDIGRRNGPIDDIRRTNGPRTRTP